MSPLYAQINKHETGEVPWCHGFEPYPLLIVLSFPQNSSKTVRHSYQFETVPEPCMRAAKQLAVLVWLHESVILYTCISAECMRADAWILRAWGWNLWFAQPFCIHASDLAPGFKTLVSSLQCTVHACAQCKFVCWRAERAREISADFGSGDY